MGRECRVIEDCGGPFVDSHLEVSKGESVGNIESGLLIGQKQPWWLNQRGKSERREWSKV